MWGSPCVTAVAGVMPSIGVPDIHELRDSELHRPFTAKGAFFYHRPQFLGALADRVYDVLLPGGEANINWVQGVVQVFGPKPERRLTAFYGDNGVTCKYSGRSLRATHWAEDQTCVLSSVRRLVECATGERFNSCLLNLYRDGRDSISPHSDSEGMLVPGSSIVAVSLGATREFWVKSKAETSAIPLQPAMFPATHGSLVVMRGAAQRCFAHWVPPDPQVTAPRISLTFRRAR